MCGRFAITTMPELLREQFGYVDQPNFPPRFNIAPTQPVPVVTIIEGRRRFVLMRWGFLPGWVKEPNEFPLVINIRAETAREKPSFRAAFQRRRGLMPVDGFYEWRRDGRVSTPYLIRRADGAPFAFPALWETWASPDGSEIDTAALMTTEASGSLQTIHPRQPIILDPTSWDEWLDPATSPDRAEALLKAPLQGELELRRIGTAVNKVTNDGPEVQDEAGDEDAAPRPAKAPKPAAKPKAPPGDEGQGSLF
ncbi:SOS response-associated peptidase [Phreatobacter stygius]|uniref:Abasic site processing protein n=1 Tax=Phreatobacter stygius TaxID=1940610 RepID=A0A4D7BDT8_9HYPH|nr:SOS response-associated peptidase [Phreatobacter stygius]QCI66152.1 SOS response-associated peptidase [Phreatobacter stygius]